MYPERIVLFTLNNGKEIGFTLYGLLIGIGVAAAFAILWTYSKRYNLDQRNVDNTTYGAIFSVALGFFFAMFFQALYSYIDNPENGFDVFGSGLTFLGGLIGGTTTFAIFYVIFRKRLGLHFVDISSIIPCGILFAHSLGRFGCFCAGCCYGIPTDGPFGIVFPGMTQAVYPTQLFEAVFLMVMFIICSALYLKFKFEYNFPLYMITYGLFRFFIEFIRDDYRGELVSGVTPSQFWSLFMIGLGIIGFFWVRFWLKRRRVQLAKTPVKPIVDIKKLKSAQ